MSLLFKADSVPKLSDYHGPEITNTLPFKSLNTPEKETLPARHKLYLILKTIQNQALQQKESFIFILYWGCMYSKLVGKPHADNLRKIKFARQPDTDNSRW